MNKTMKKILAGVVIFSLLLGICPNRYIKVTAATASATLHNMGELGSLDVGSKTKSGNWWKIFVGDEEVFCLNMGYTCHRGDVYQSQTESYSSDDSGKNSLLARIGYWFAHTKKRSNKAYVFSQALFWAVEEGDTSESKLKKVLTTMKNHTNYYSSTTVDNLYNEIFSVSGVVSVEVEIWKYAGSGTHRQELMHITTSDVKEFEPEHLSKQETYRQRITLDKTDEDGKPLAGVEFMLSVDNLDELYSFMAKGLGESESGSADEDMSCFELTKKTDANGRIAFRFTYEVQSREYYYYSDDDLKTMSEQDKTKAIGKLDEEGYAYHPSLTRDGAEDLAKVDLDNQIKQAKNRYVLTEISTGDDSILVNPEYSQGKEIVLDSSSSWFKDSISGEWPDTSSKTYADYTQAYKVGVENKYKKISVRVSKKDGYSKDEKAHGDASLDGAQFQIFENAECTKPAEFYNEKGEKVQRTVYEVKNQVFDTDYLRCGKTYYLKEIRAPKGYLLKADVIPIEADGKKYDLEYTSVAQEISVTNQPILGQIAVLKVSSDGSAGPVMREEGAQFQVYLKSKGSFDACDEYEKSLITTDKEGYACSGKLYFGTYIVHQISTGGHDNEKVDDFEVGIYEQQQSPIVFLLNDPPYKAYLRVVKKDQETGQTILKANTAYQIYRVNPENGEETLVKQSYRDGHSVQTVEYFLTDEKGVIMTVEPLESGTYRIYEKSAPPGSHIQYPYIEIEISSQNISQQTQTDINGRTYTVVTAEYENRETYGKLTIKKLGERLQSYENGQFVYGPTGLQGVGLKIYAKEDVKTQDNQGTNWFDKDELVADISSGEKVDFTKECGGLCSAVIEPTQDITIHLPLGKYRVVETSTLPGFVRSQREWDLAFEWENGEEESVINSTNVTDAKGNLTIVNERTKALICIKKVDEVTKQPIAGVEFELYTKDDIYNQKGNKIVEAGTLLQTAATDSDGRVDFDIDLPLKSEWNTGEYYVKEIRTPAGYYPSVEEIPVQLTYIDDSTPVVTCEKEISNRQTEVEIDKLSVSGSHEIEGCQLKITDAKGRNLLSWTSGKEDSVKFNDELDRHEYQNLRANFDERGNLQIGGLHSEASYILTETRPADGYVTAESIEFKLVQNSDLQSEYHSLVQTRMPDGNFGTRADNVVCMYDGTTNVEFRKTMDGTEKLLGGAKINILDHQGKKVYTFTTKKGKPVLLKGILRVGETYTFREVKAPEGYQKAKEVSVKIKDISQKQVIWMNDKKMIVTEDENTPKINMETEVPKSGKNINPPATGSSETIIPAVVLLLGSGLGGWCIHLYKRRKKY